LPTVVGNLQWCRFRSGEEKWRNGNQMGGAPLLKGEGRWHDSMHGRQPEACGAVVLGQRQATVNVLEVGDDLMGRIS
jgi:hypothetical protein